MASSTMKPAVSSANVGFVRRQISEVKEGGLSVLLRKSLMAPRLALALPIVLVLRALRPWVLVRFGQLNSLPIGMFAAATEMYLCQRDAGLHPGRTLDILHCGDRISNRQLRKMWGRKLHITPMGRLLHQANNLLPGGAAHLVNLPNDEDRLGLIPRSAKHLSFTDKEERLGRAGLESLGLPEGAPFVCLYVRDTGYKGRDSGHQWSALLNQDENIHGYRNSSINNYMLAAEELTKRGYFVIRMGAVVNDPLQTTNPMIIDYATQARSDFMDIFLCAHCRFFLGGNGGLNAVPRVFRRPVMSDNFIPLALTNTLTLYPENLLIPKKLWLEEEHRFMTFADFLDTWPENFDGTRHFQRIGVEVVENTPEELLAATVEMDERINGTWQTTEEDEELQQRFWSILGVREPDPKFRPRMGTEFLRQNRDLLN